ncbi:MAG: sirohydrochlorin chelatase [Bryobacteraceae bacterium]
MKTGIVVFAHGSRVESANQAVRDVVAAMLRPRGPYEHVETAFLELGQPDLEGAAARLAAAGVGRIVVIPYFLTLGLHLERDLPRLVQEIAHKFTGIELLVTPPLDGHPALAQILLDRARAALA